MKINIISLYFPPEKGAAASRIFNMAHELSNRDVDIQVVTALPNYPTGKIFKGYGGFVRDEVIDNIKVRRHWVYASNSKNPILRILSMFSFAITICFSFLLLHRRKAEITIVNSPPLLAAISGIFLGGLTSKKVVSNISDLWPSSALELGAIKRGAFYTFLELIEKMIYKRSNLLICQSNETIKHIRGIYTDKKVILYRNIPKQHENENVFQRSDVFRIIYAGLLGVAQGLYNLISSIDFAKLNTELHVFGEGNEANKIKEYISINPGCNVFLHGFVSPLKINEMMPNFDASLIPLKSHIYGAFPSKIFNSINAGLPVLFSGQGEGSIFIEENNLGLTNDPSELKMLEENILKLKSMDSKEYIIYREEIFKKSSVLCNYIKNNDLMYKELKKLVNE